MNKFEFEISVNGTHTLFYVYANNVLDAKKILEAQFYNAKITYFGYRQVR